MIQPKVVLAADTLIQDVLTNSISIIRVHEGFYPAGYPLLIPRFTVFTLFERAHDDPAVAQGHMTVLLNEQPVFNGNIDINFQGALIHRSILQFAGLVVPQPGNLKIRVSVGDQIMESYNMPAQPAGAPPVPLQGGQPAQVAAPAPGG